MDAQRKAVAEKCLTASYEATMEFPMVIRTLMEAGFEGYLVDYRKGSTTYYMLDSDSVELVNHETDGSVATVFDAGTVEANVRKSQAGAHSYQTFCTNVKAAGCAGYVVSFLGRRVTYFGRTAETHVELFPQ